MTGLDLKNSILQLAIQGKLVAQDANDEPASVLLERIKAEKKKLVEEKKIKKEKPLAEITEDEKPFEIPDSWEWVRLIDVVENIADIDHKMPPTVEENGYPYISPANFTTTGIDFKSAKMVGEKDFLQLSSKCKPKRNDIIFPRYGTIGKIRLIDSDIDFLVSYSCCTIQTYCKNILYKYIFHVLSSPFIQRDEINKYINKTTQPNVGLQSIKMFLFPLPPLSEQKRIVAKIEELMPLVDEYDKAQKELDALNTAMPEQLKQSILQEAIMGKLGTNNPDDEPASELLKRIRKEKEQLIKDKKIKKEKTLPEITDEEKPFDIPDNWVWCRLGEIGITNTGTTPSKSESKYWGNYIPFLGPGDIKNGIINYSNNSLSKEGYTNARPVDTNTILQVCIGGSIGKCAIVNREVTFNQQINSITVLLASFRCIYYWMQTDTFNKSLIEHSTGTATPIINKSAWDQLLIPLPPLAEQHRIVSKIENLFAFIEPLAKDLK